LAHLARPLKIIKSLEASEFDIALAADLKYQNLIESIGIVFQPLASIPAELFSDIVDKANPIYSESVFNSHIDEDLKIIEKVKPDIVVGDFRHSLSVSCRLSKVKYVNITNAYWSPEIVSRFPIPEAPAVRILGERFIKLFCMPFVPIIIKFNFFNMAFLVRKSTARIGLKFNDYRNIITDGDVILFCDTPELVPLKQNKPNQFYIGPLIWSMPCEFPAWWPTLAPNKKKILVSLGSSGNLDVLPVIIAGLRSLGEDIHIIVTLSGKKNNLPAFPNVHTVDFLPFDNLEKEFALVIGNGGSPICHASLSWGTPCIGIIFNNDQLLNMIHVQNRGAGVLLRFWNLTAEIIKSTVEHIFSSESYSRSAKSLKKEFENYDLGKIVKKIVTENT